MNSPAELLFEFPSTTGATAHLLFGETSGNSIDLLFDLPATTGATAHLLFGETANRQDKQASLFATLPPVGFRAQLIPLVSASLSAVLPGLGLQVALMYSVNVARPTVGKVRTEVNTAQALPSVGVSHPQAVHDARPSGGMAQWVRATGRTASTQFRHQVGASSASVTRAVAQGAARTHSALPPEAFSVANRTDTFNQSVFQNATRTRRSTWAAHQVMGMRSRPAHTGRWKTGRGVGLERGNAFSPATWAAFSFGGRFQTAKPVNGGVYVAPPGGPAPCYQPEPNLVFAGPWLANPALLFFCETHSGGTDPDPDTDPDKTTVIVPIRRVYVVMNDVRVQVAASGLELPALSVSMSIDTNSWTWSFSASFPAQALPNLEPTNGQPTELNVRFNGNTYCVLVENISRERSFGSGRIQVGGRGKSAVLAAPYAAVSSFTNTQQRTAQQLVADVLTQNGVSIGWDVEWGLQDWVVPAGAFSVQGTRVDAINAIAAAAGGYVQPHATLPRLRVLPRYPVAPWAWQSVTPDYELPAAVMTRESVEWQNKPEYNRVWVSGQQDGVLGQITRMGTAGDLLAPMITDPLITHLDAARQRGLAVLSDTGRQALINLSLPVLPETGVIPPGKFVRYTDAGVSRVGLSRSVQVQTSGSASSLRQTVLLETHE